MLETRNAHQSDEKALIISGYRVVKLTGNFNRPPYTKPLHRNLNSLDNANHPKEGAEVVANQAWATYLAAPSFPV